MKRLLSLALVAVMLLTLCLVLASCEKAVCDTCGEEFFAKEKNISGMFGNDVYTCNDCIEDYNDIKEGLEDIFGDK